MRVTRGHQYSVHIVVDPFSIARDIGSNAADVYVHDVWQTANELIEKEGLCPTKILESMSCGRPVIAPKESELEDMLRKSNGGFCAASVEEVEALIEVRWFLGSR